jgi:HAE1 family hydrophobic/amphiphilic exporter-1
MIKASIYKPITMLMVLLTVVVFGIYTYRMMAVNMLPDFTIPVVTAVVVYPGASPEELESTIIKPIEDQVELIDGIDYTTAYALENYAIFILMFNMGINVDVAANDVREKIEAVQLSFPDAVEDAIIQKVDINGQSIIDFALTGPVDQTELRTLADDFINPKISSVPGVASVDIFGGTEREISIELNKEAMVSHTVDIATIMGIVGQANLTGPFGEMKGNIKNTNIRLDSKFRSTDEIRALEIPTAKGTIRLSDIAVVKDTIKEINSASRYNGINAVSLSIKKRTDANVVAVADGVLKAVENLNKTLPEGFEIHLIYDKSLAIRESVDNVLSNIIMAIILTAGILLLFLGKFSSMFIAAVTMPVCVIGAFTFMYFAGFTINVMTLMALSSSVGLLVTNSIVVLENIITKINDGLEPKEAAYKGTSEIMVAIMASTLTNVCVFVPIAFMQSVAGVMFRSFGLTMVFATFVSLLVTFTLTPLMAAYLYKGRKRNADGTFVEPKENIISKLLSIFPKGMDLIRSLYLSTLKFALSRVGVVVQILAVLGVILFTAFMAMQFLSVEMMPKQDEGIINIKIELPSGTNIEKTNAVILDVEKRIADIPELERYNISIGGNNSMSGANAGNIKMNLVELDQGRTRSTDQIIDSLRLLLANIPDAYVTVKSVNASEMGAGQQGDVVFEVMGLNPDSVLKATQLAMDKIQGIKGAVEIKSSYEEGKPEFVLRPNRAALAEYGITAKAISTIGYIYMSGYEASTYTEDGEEYDIYVRLDKNDLKDLNSIADLPILTPKGYVPAKVLFDIERKQGANQITRKSKQRLVSISMNLLPGYTSGQIMGEVTKATSQIENLPEGVTFSFGASADMQNEMVEEFIAAIIMAILLTYILLVALLESFSQPFIILTTIPMGGIGVIGSLVITGKSISVISLMAIVMLIGVVVNNAILLLDEANRLFRTTDMGRRSSILKASEAKFQAIALATIASAIAQLPLALGIGGKSAAMTQPMGIACIGGLIVSAILTMYLIPTFFWLPNALFHKVKKVAQKKKQLN